MSKRVVSRKDVMVSVRLPRSLLDELHDLKQANHFMDLSDEIRFIVRKYCFSFLSSQQGAGSQQDLMLEQKKREQAIDSLTRIISELKSSETGSKKIENNGSVKDGQ